PEDQAGPHLERQVEGRGVRARHLLAGQRRVWTVVHDRLGLGHVEEREERPGEHQDDEAVQGDLAQHERPVVREDLVERATGEARGAEPVVEPLEDPADHSLPPLGLLHQPGPTGSGKSPRAIRYPDGSTSSPSCGSGRGAGPNTTCAPSSTSNADWWHWHCSWCRAATNRP